MPDLTANILVFPPETGAYLILPERVIDGDTISFFWLVRDTGRLNGINAPELHAKDHTPGEKAKAFLESIIPNVATRAIVHGREKYGRALLDLFGADGVSLAQKMIAAGHALPWDGHGVRPT